MPCTFTERDGQQKRLLRPDTEDVRSSVACSAQQRYVNRCSTLPCLSRVLVTYRHKRSVTSCFNHNEHNPDAQVLVPLMLLWTSHLDGTPDFPNETQQQLTLPIQTFPTPTSAPKDWRTRNQLLRIHLHYFVPSSSSNHHQKCVFPSFEHADLTCSMRVHLF